MANAKEKGKLCDQIQLPVNKDGLCVDSECQNKCREAKGPKGTALPDRGIYTEDIIDPTILQTRTLIFQTKDN
ncbi:hypothetical protein YC2023_065118 [Brassica napus]